MSARRIGRWRTYYCEACGQELVEDDQFVKVEVEGRTMFSHRACFERAFPEIDTRPLFDKQEV